jgi:surface antigen
MAAIIGAVSAGGCSYQLETAGLPKADADVEQSGSIVTADRHASRTATNTANASETDLAYARAVAAEAMARGPKDVSVPWENPNTGANGNITPLATGYRIGGATCRDFLASYVLGQAQSWFQGEACRGQQGKWEVKTLKPFKQG